MALALSHSRGGTPWSRRALFTGIPLRARAEADFWIRVSRTAMACRFEVTLASRDAAWVPAARAALDGVDAIEHHLSLFRDTSRVADLNRRAAAEAVAVDDRLFVLLSLCRDLHHDTGGAFDVTSTPLSRCWGFLQREGCLPSTESIANAMSKVGMDHVRLDPAARAVRFARDGVELNFGAVGKGYALDLVAGGMRESGVQHALLSAGRSSLLAIGGRDGGWRVDIASPRVEGALARVFLRNAAVGTSGAGEQFVVVDGVRYGHVLDPRTGWPASGILSATVVASSSAVADALSTAFLIGGPRLAHEYCASHRDVLALITVEGPRQTILIGHHPGALVEEA
jgi:thiamine biosynthesis lipoprotein